MAKKMVGANIWILQLKFKFMKDYENAEWVSCVKGEMAGD